MKLVLAAIAAATLAIAAPAQAEVKQTWEAGFRLESKATIAAPPEKVWAALGQIGKWWSSAHSWSGDAANMTLDVRAGGCFCETLPNGGGVQHGVVVMAMTGKTLRLSAPLGPMQDEGLSAALTFSLKAVEGGTEVVMTYNVGGARPETVGFAKGVDGVLSEQLGRLKRYAETGKPQ